ncbi:hypothetical protein [Streptomyces sp. UNOB3_S3]|uniref:effector-associated constant component EACC1 n=1 Tax=Streptomyces sp. UNOB3_S3 TaxID=2871682 RepID=UPI001E5AB35A|nr:hypothetical protein [Streptomyces sp. UNOB3_S3]MCC3776077.1 hypothetical protein [Streptomyces sp. UNOB3_S3]
MSIIPAGEPVHRISIVDDDPLRARREARELLAEIAAVDPHAKLVVPEQQATRGTDKGGTVTELVGLAFGGGSFVVAVVQAWLSRVAQRTIVATRPDGTSLRLTGREARADNDLIERFLNGGTVNGEGDEAGPSANGEDGPHAE